MKWAMEHEFVTEFPLHGFTYEPRTAETQRNGLCRREGLKGKSQIVIYLGH